MPLLLAQCTKLLQLICSLCFSYIKFIFSEAFPNLEPFRYADSSSHKTKLFDLVNELMVIKDQPNGGRLLYHNHARLL